MKIRDIMAIVAAAVMAGGCSSDDGMQTREGRVPITLTASVGTSATTRGVQEELLIEDEKVYVWGKEGTGDYDYLKAWTLTADGSNGWKSGYTPKYYPLSGETLTMVALHGNFSYTEGTSDLTATISHSVEADQNATNAYEKSDLLWASETGSSTNATNKRFDFTHMLSKIEVKLHPGEGYADISSAEVMLRGVLPTIAITPTDGSLGSASGSATLIKARKTEDHLSDATPYALYEVIIPPQDAPTSFLNIKIGNKLATVAADVASFGSNKRYVYDITITEFKVNVTSSIASWGYDAGGTPVNADVTNDKDVQIGRPKLPIEYVADYNMKTATAFATSDVPSQTAYFTWNVPANLNAFKNGTAVAGYHLPSKREWCTIIPPYRAYNSSTPDSDIDDPEGPRIGSGCGKKTNMGEYMSWGVTNNNGTYTYEVSRKFYNDYNSIDDPAHERIFYALRFRDKDGSTYKNGLYTCAYRYQYFYDETISANSYLVIKVKYVGFNQNIDIDAISDEGWWLTSDFSKSFSVTGCYGWDGVFYPAGSYGASSDKFRQPWRMYYWSCSSIDADSHWATIIGPGFFMAGEGGDKLYSFPVRLFKDVGTP